jgi:hypothetical protein
LKLASHATYTFDAYDYPLEVLERQEQYAGISWKAMTSTLPIAVYYAPQVPLGEVFLWPIPTVDITLVVYPWQPLRQFPSLDTELDFPPGYPRALRLALALEASASYGVQPSPVLVRNADEAKRAIYPINTDIGRLRLNPGAGVPSSGLADFLAGRY